MSKTETTPTPPLGHKALTPLYDAAIALLTRERKWRSAFVDAIAPKAGDKIIDISSGTGSLALALHQVSPQTHYYGVDPDTEAVQRAKVKAKRAGSLAKFKIGYFSADAIPFEGPPDKIISSLVLHQVPLAEKRRIIEGIFKALKPDGSVQIADYGLQTGMQRKLFRMTVQALDGVEDTQPNADGILPGLLQEAGFSDVAEAARIATLTGTISIYTASRKPL
ncbi:MAG: class I SAM-dependent methyltransferase [Pseudomonadota bacterium]